MTASMKFEETTHLIKEMMTVYETDDAAIIHEIIKKQADCQKIAEKRQQEGKRVVKGLSRLSSRRICPHCSAELQTTVLAQEQELSKHVPAEIHTARVENLERQKVHIFAR